MFTAFPWVLAVFGAHAEPSSETMTGSEKSDGEIRIVWQGEQLCDGEAQVEAALQRMLEGLSVPEAGILAEIEVSEVMRSGKLASEQAVESTLNVQIRMVAGEQRGEKNIEVTSCEELIDATAFSIALTVDPRANLLAGVGSAQGEGYESREEGKKGTLAQPMAPVERSECPELVCEKESSPILQQQILGLEIGAGIGTGMLPGVSANLLVGFHVRLRGLRAGLISTLWLPKGVESPSAEQVEGRFMLWTLGAQACGVPATGAFEFPLCAAFQLGSMRGEAEGAVSGSPELAPYMDLMVGPAVFWSVLPALALSLQMNGIISIVRPEFMTEPSGTLFRVPPAGYQIMLGIEFRPFTIF